MLVIKPKQLTVIDLLKNPKIHTIVLIGSVGTGKTDIAAHAAISVSNKFPKTYFTVFRQNISTAKKSVIPSYLNMLDMMNFVEGHHYKYNRSDFEINFLHNRSKIGFIEADVTKDRQGRKIKGINATANHIDEADEIAQVMFTTATSRRGRRNQNRQPSVSIITMNPNDSYLKELYYDPWKKGTLPAGVAVVEFTLEDSWQSKQDIEAMMTNPEPWKQRFLFNNWEYQDDDDSLFKYRYFTEALVHSYDRDAIRYAGNDVARGKMKLTKTNDHSKRPSDRSVIAQWAGRTLIDIKIIKDKNESMKTDIQTDKIIQYMTENSIVADNVAVDAVGVGVGVVDGMHSKGIDVKEFVSQATPYDPRYADLRSQVIWEFAQGLEKGTIKIWEGCPFRNELIFEAMAHLHEIDGKKLKVESKEQVKERTGSISPDILDAVVMGLYPQLSINPDEDDTGIIF